jgi:hypothetical protein
MSWRRLLLAILALYPKAWRQRYRRETEPLVEDLLAGGARGARWRLALDLLAGAGRERAQEMLRRLRHGTRPGAPRQYRPVSLLRYRNVFGRTSFDRRSLAVLGGEQVIGTFGGVTSFPRLRRAMSTWVAWSIIVLAFNASYQRVFPDWRWVEQSGICATAAAVAWVICRVGRSRRYVYVVTPAGIIECRPDWLGRPRVVTQRVPAGMPRLVDDRGKGQCRFAVGEREVWLDKSAAPILQWMSWAERDRRLTA